MRHIHADHMIVAANDTSIKWQYTPKAMDLWNDCVDGIPAWYPESEYRQKPSPHPHQAMMDQAKADPSIKWQVSDPLDEMWVSVNPSWDVTLEYRQKPAEPKMVELWQWAVRLPYSKQVTTTNFYATEDEARYESVEILCRIEGSKITVPEVSQ